MPLYIASLNSGSNGNCYYVGSAQEAVLVDAGISCRETEHRMLRLGLSMDRLRAVFISHEHTDHTRGVEVIARKYRIPVYITAATQQNSKLWLDPDLTRTFSPLEPVTIGGLFVQAFPKKHDAAEPHSFIIEGEGITVGVMTDMGSACEHVVKHFSRCNAAFLEANYDEQMLEKGTYPLFLKNRIRSDEGHLSNRQALELFLGHRSPALSHLLLSHLSEHNNHPQLVQDLFGQHSNGAYIAVAGRYKETGVFRVG